VKPTIKWLRAEITQLIKELNENAVKDLENAEKAEKADEATRSAAFYARRDCERCLAQDLQRILNGQTWLEAFEDKPCES
jgi:hypothetical protein